MGQRMPQRYERPGTQLHLSNGYQKNILCFQTHNSTSSKMTQSWEKGAQELHVFARNQDHIYNSQMGIQIRFHICKWRIFLFKNHLLSGLTRINPETIWIWSKWAKECLNVTSAWEPTCISQKGIKNVFYIFKPIIPLFLDSLHSRLVKLGPRMTRSWEKGPQ